MKIKNLPNNTHFFFKIIIKKNAIKNKKLKKFLTVIYVFV